MELVPGAELWSELMGLMGLMGKRGGVGGACRRESRSKHIEGKDEGRYCGSGRHPSRSNSLNFRSNGQQQSVITSDCFPSRINDNYHFFWRNEYPNWKRCRGLCSEKNLQESIQAGSRLGPG